MTDAAPALFVFDVDGTLLTDDHEIAPATRRAVDALLAAGHRVALASARPPRSVAEISADLLGNGREIVALNGAVVARGEELLHRRSLSADDAAAIVERAHDLGLEINLYADWAWYVETAGPGVEAEAAIVGFEPTRVDDVEALAREAAHKILLMGTSAALRVFRTWMGRAELDVAASASKSTYCEIVARDVSKGGAVLELAERAGIPRERIVAFGDAENDLSMLAAAGTGVAMGNAPAPVRSAADHVTTGNDQGGIPRALRALGHLPSDLDADSDLETP